MEKQKAKVAGLLIFAALATLFLLNQITSTSEPTSIYSPGPRQPLAMPTHSASLHPRPNASPTLSQPRTVAPAPRVTAPRHDTRYGHRKPLHHRPVHHPRPPSHHPKPPGHHPTPPPPSTPPRDPGVLCRLLGICLRNLTHLGISLHP